MNTINTRTVPPGSSVRLELLIAEYSAAIWSQPFGGIGRLDELSCAVEAEADAIGYQGHGRLLALHTAAERACVRDVA